jgi:hypothetical protein
VHNQARNGGKRALNEYAINGLVELFVVMNSDSNFGT